MLPSGVDQTIDVIFSPIQINNQRLYNSVLLKADIILFTLNRENIQEF